MKRFLSRFFAVVMIISLSSNYSAIASNKTSFNFYVSTPEIPLEVVEYARSDFSGHLMAVIESGDILCNPNEVCLGTPFTFLSSDEVDTQYYFPVIYNNDIVYIYRVYEDVFYYNQTGILRYSSSMSSGSVEIFSNLAEKSSKINPAFLSVNNHNVSQCIYNFKQ